MQFSLSLTLIFAVLVLPALGIAGAPGYGAEVPEDDIAALRPNTANPDELGYVDWIRDFNEASALARKEGKPMLILFQEVPGCNTASGYGINVLRHPLIVEAIETLFVPLAIYNNKTGQDAEVLRTFGEPAWNNPVVRIVGADKAGYAPRLSGDYTQAGLVNNMIQALEKKNADVPPYLRLLAAELNARRSGTDSAVIAMSCFWSGEGSLGGKKGVISTRPGFMGGREVVKVEYDPQVVSFSELLQTAKSSRVADGVFTDDETESAAAARILGSEAVSPLSDFSPDGTPKYYMSGTAYRRVPMTDTQASRVNAYIGRHISPDSFLSRRQLAILELIRYVPGADWPGSHARDSGMTADWQRVLSVYDMQSGKAQSKR